MKKIYFLKYPFLLLLFVNIRAEPQAQNINLIDINKQKDSYPFNNKYSSMNMFAELKGIFYFSADDGVHGNELWSSDGTNAGTKLIKDINPGTLSSNPSEITVSGNKIYFLTSNGADDQQLWMSDGTDAGTHLVIDLLPVSVLNIYGKPAYLTDVNGTLYFFINYFNFNTSLYSIIQLWKTDGTQSGTVMISDLAAKFKVTDVRHLVNVNGRLFFVLYSFEERGTELYSSDGTAKGTTLVADINPNSYGSSYPSYLTVLNGLLYFSADDGSGSKLWVSNGTASGTHAVNNRHNIYVPNVPYISAPYTPFEIRGNTLFFQGGTATSGYELCKYDASDVDNNVTLVKDIKPGENSSYPNFITNVKGTLFFTIGAAGADAQLWKSDGTKAGTALVKDIDPGGENFYSNLINVNGTLFFTYGNLITGCC